MQKKIIKKRIIALLGLACVSHPLLAKELTVWAWDPKFNVAIMQEAAERYQEVHPDVTINVIDFGKEEVEQKLQTMLASGVTSALPDIVLIEDYNGPKYLSSYPGAFAPMTKAIDYSQFAPYKIDIMSKDGEIYGIPFDAGVTGLYYRTDRLAAAGFNAKDLDNITWDRMIEIGQAVQAKSGGHFLSNNPSDIGLLRMMMQSAGSWYFNKDGSLNIKNNKVLAESIRVYAELYSSKVTRPTLGRDEWVGTMNSGAVSAVVSGVWVTPSVKAAKDQSGLWAIAPTPRLNIANSVNASNLGGSSWFVLNSSEEKATAIDFLNTTFATDSEFYATILQDFGAVGTYLPAGKTDAYHYPDSFFGSQKIYADFNKWAAKIPAVNYGMFTYEAEAAISSLIPSVIQGAPIDEMLESVEQQLKYQIQ